MFIDRNQKPISPVEATCFSSRGDNHMPLLGELRPFFFCLVYKQDAPTALHNRQAVPQNHGARVWQGERPP
jgi:hypothetical protein